MNNQLKAHALPSQVELKRAFIYNQITGEMFNKKTGKYYTKSRYQRITFNGIKYLAHRIAWKMITGVDPVGVIDHKNEDPSDNRFENLQDISNQENIAKAKATNPHRGIYPPNYKGNRCKGWTARPTINGVKRYLGSFPTKQAAVGAAQQARLEAADTNA